MVCRDANAANGLEPLEAVEVQQPAHLEDTPSGGFTDNPTYEDQYLDNGEQYDANSQPLYDTEPGYQYVDEFGQPIESDSTAEQQQYEAQYDPQNDNGQDKVQDGAQDGLYEYEAGTEDPLYTDEFGRPVDSHGYLLDSGGQLLLDSTGLPVYAYDEVDDDAMRETEDEVAAPDYGGQEGYGEQDVSYEDRAPSYT